MTSKEELRELLPKVGFNKNFKKRQAYLFKKREKAREAEREIITGKKHSPARPSEASVSAKPKTAKKSAASTGKKASAKTSSAKVKKVRVPKLQISNEATGKETLKKKKARELVRETRKQAKDARKAIKKLKPTREEVKSISCKAATADVKTRIREVRSSEDTREALAAAEPKARNSVITSAAEAPKLDAEKHQLTSAERDQELLARTIRGEDINSGASQNGAMDGATFMRQDPSLYPDLAFLDDYAEKKHSDVVSADQLLSNAHRFFKDLSKRERNLYKVAKQHIDRLRAVNRRGGDAEGFRYVVPKNVKNVVRELLLAQKSRNGEEDPEALVDPSQLVSTFGGDGVAETSDRPARRRRRQRSHSYTDFYQFQVSKQWARNAENFLKRSRPNRVLFEAKKHQRSIKKL